VRKEGTQTNLAAAPVLSPSTPSTSTLLPLISSDHVSSKCLSFPPFMSPVLVAHVAPRRVHIEFQRTTWWQSRVAEERGTSGSARQDTPAAEGGFKIQRHASYTAGSPIREGGPLSFPTVIRAARLSPPVVLPLACEFHHPSADALPHLHPQPLDSHLQFQVRHTVKSNSTRLSALARPAASVL